MIPGTSEELRARLGAGQSCVALLPAWPTTSIGGEAAGHDLLRRAARDLLPHLGGVSRVRVVELDFQGPTPTLEWVCFTIFAQAMADGEAASAPWEGSVPYEAALAVWRTLEPSAPPEERLAAAFVEQLAGQRLVLVLALARGGRFWLLQHHRKLLATLLGSLSDPLPRPVTLCIVARENQALREAAEDLGMSVDELEPMTSDQETGR